MNSLETPGGTERVTVMLADELSKIEKYKIIILSLNKKGDPFFDIPELVNLIYLNKRQTKLYRDYLSNIIKLRRFIKKNKPDYIIDVCSAMSLFSIPACIKTNVKVITWEHFNANVEWNPITPKIARKLATLFSKEIVVLTDRDKQLFEEKYNAKNVRTIPNPVTINCRKKTNLNNKNILSVGRFTNQKGFDLLIKAWSLTKIRNNGWILNIYGKGEQLNILMKLIDEDNLADTVVLHEPVKDIVPIYINSSIYVMSSRFEGLPLVLIEATSMGLPVISFDCETGPREIIKNDINGVLVRPGDVKQLAFEIDNLVNDKKRMKKYSNNAIINSKLYNIAEIVKLWKGILC